MSETQEQSRWRPRTPGLRGRVALAMVVVVIIACAVLTLTTTAWAAQQNRQVQEALMHRVLQSDIETLFLALEVNPEARTLDELADAGWSPNLVTSEGEGILIPLESQEGDIAPESALQWGFVNVSSPLSERYPECVGVELNGTLGLAGSSVVWNEQCGPYLMAYGLAQPEAADGGMAKPWLVIRALYLPDQHDPVPALRNTLLAISGGIVAVTALLALAVARNVVRPVARAGAMAAAVADGDLSVRIPVRGGDDVAAMSRAVNTMADRLTAQISDLERANESQRRFVSDVAHELRTPTTALLASAEALRDPGTRDESAALVAPQLRRLATLTEDLLEISRMDAGKAGVVPSRIDVVDLIAEVIAGTRATYTGPPELLLDTDPIRVQVILQNLVANALQHGAPPITVMLAVNESSVVIDVHDGGAGVPESLRDHVFDRFVRGDEARHGTSSGLGLAIAHENARLLGGSLTLEPDSTTFRVTLPTDSREEEQ